MTRQSCCLAGLLVAMMFVLPARAAEPDTSSANSGPSTNTQPETPSLPDASTHWQFALTPYLWLPSVSGSLRFSLPGGGAGASTGPYNYLENLRFALMLQGEARKGDWSLFSDFIYLNFGQHNSSVDTSGSALVGETQRDAKTSLTGVLVQLGGGRTVARWQWGSADAIVGLRYLGINSTLDASFSASGSNGQTASTGIHASQTQNVFNGFAGVRGRLLLTDSGRWFVPYYLDIGAGSSRFTWQAMSGVGYAAKWCDVSVTYRYLAFYGSSDQFVQSLRFHGPSANFTFRF